MSTVKELLMELNTLRAQSQLPALMSWKKSKQQLEDLIKFVSVPTTGKPIPEHFQKAIDAFADDVINKRSPKASVKRLEKSLTVARMQPTLVAHAPDCICKACISKHPVTVCPTPRPLRELEQRKAMVDKLVEKRMNGADAIRLPASESVTALADLMGPEIEAAKKRIAAQKAERAARKAMPKVQKKVDAPRVEGPAPAPTGQTVSLVSIARELNIPAKIARAKMRRVNIPADYLVAKHTYKLEYKAWVISALQTDFRKERSK